MQEDLRPLLAALATTGALTSAHGVTLGDLEVRSALGERLEARVRVEPAAGERVDASCFSVLSEVPQGLSAIAGLQVTLDANGTGLRLTSRGPVTEPAAGLALRAACPGAGAESVREYVLLLDPLPAGASTVVSARRGETLDSLARSLVSAAGPRREYLVAIRTANPSLAAVGDREMLTEGTRVVLPDLRPAMRGAPAKTAPKARARSAPASAPATSDTQSKAAPKPDAQPESAKAPQADAVAPNFARERALAAAPAKTVEPAPPAPPAARPAKTVDAAPTAPPAARPKARGDFALKLSSSEVDLSRSQQVNDAQRQQLRERLMVLDADDQVAALLAMRHSLKQLEGRVAELQLKLAAMPETFPQRAPSAAAPPAQNPAPAPAPVPIPAPAATAPAATPPAPTPAAPVPAATPPAPAASAPEPAAPAPAVQNPAPAPAPAPTPAVAAPAPDATPPAPTATAPEPAPEAEPAAHADKKPKVIARPAPPSDFSISDWMWAAGAVLVLLLLWLAMRMRRGRDEETFAVADLRDGPATEELVPDDDDFDSRRDATIEMPAVRSGLAPDASRDMRRNESPDNLRRRYIEERFPEVINGTIVLEDAASVVKGARLFYEDGAMPRAVELLQFAIEDRPSEVRTWLALFEIFRVERLAGEYAELAQRFQAEHGKSDEWRKVRFFGREIDPGNPLYREDAVNTLETIGPREGRRLSANLASVDPIAENWLMAPMDFENEVLANELRNALMAQAQLTEQDLIPNPMPALRNVEMFTVA